MPAPTADFLLNRRAFLKVGIAGAATLAVAGVGATLTGCTRREHAAAQGYRFLRDADVALLRALMPAVLEGLPLDAQLADGALRGIDEQVARTEAAPRAQLAQLLDLLHFAPTRWLTTGVGSRWDRASPNEVRDFLERWRTSRVGMFNAGYNVLVRLVGLGYFGQPAGAAAAGYPGPLARVYQAVNA